MTRGPSSIAARLAWMFGLAAAVVALVAGVALYAFQSRELHRHRIAELTGRMEIVERMVSHNRTAENWPRIAERLNDYTPQDQQLRFLIDSGNPAYRVGTDFLDEARLDGPEQGVGHAVWRGMHYLTLSRDIAANEGRPAVRLVIAIGRREVDQARLVLAIGVSIISLITIVSVFFLGRILARRSLAPVDRLSEDARLIGTDPSLRLPTAKLPAELEGLVLAFNEALDRLQQSHAQLSSFNADVAHELRTPLGNLIGETQVALSRQRSAEDLEDVLQSNLEEMERMKHIVNGMLFLARADRGGAAANLLPLSLAAEVRNAVAFLELLLEESGMEVMVEGDSIVWIERALFGSAITNLIDNAMRHGAPDSVVSIVIAEEGDLATVSVWNRTEWIGPVDLDRMFDRFYRLDPSRQGSSSSHGLGLAIVRAVARMHGGDADAAWIDGGLRIRLSFLRHRPADTPEA